MEPILLMSLVIFLGMLAIVYAYKNETNKNKYLDLKLQYEKEGKKSLQSSRNTIRGKVTEELAPLFSDFPYELSDCKFIGSPIDYLVFDGMSKLRDTGKGEITIVISDVKTNSAVLSKIQKGIKDAIENNRIKFEKWNIKDTKLSIK